ncbi:glycosyltransferase family 4 protein [Candidatus Falkowbacteria bacterium]|nr:glycosyltransferase family 4 protein [Candidatus Falkowbacteria bacterium]
MKKKILYIITQSEFGGAQRYILELITHLNPEKYDITVAAGPGGDFLGRVKAQNFNIWRLKHLSRSINPVKDIKAYLELKTLINTTKPDILQLHSTKTGVLGSLAVKKRSMVNGQWSMKVIYRIGGWAFAEDIPFWKKWLYIKAEKWTSKYKDIIINNCEAQRQLAIKFGIAPASKIITIYNGLDLEKLNFLPREQARQKLMINDQSSMIIGTIANFYKNKGLEYLIQAASKLKSKLNVQWSMVIIGDGIERQNLEKLIKESNLENQVILPGKIKDAWQYLKAFDIFVLPSIKEGQPWAVLEAMASKTPIIATNIAAIPEMIENNKSGLLVNPKDPKAIASKIEHLIENPEIAQDLSKNAKNTLEQKFTIQNMVQKTEKLYH